MTQWQKSSFSSGPDGSNCVEVAHGSAELLLRESDDPGRVLSLAPAALIAFIRETCRR
ncbi:DUF397 domain-containing protein [Streptomyces ipomoeae]|uniref:DUF397 domain-containing protein n=1 Tax=Streptomyces ipomoeae TaxID=103232 RepID=A0A540QHI3_9ACTN|nr:DUF397 domain-containing protein [Streptomyces ipomoeae]MDX2700768.1 DUF397 domain-containing protein [Streptomyces ipomoeae]MDX2828461.1 DUF397 domain-containing protein [Streptomyces ipomoeae]MDX2845952.1 DUF397 domain-containing protein [Streptomyces ipomoeae]MDX2880139.1 DUF397 domain-containing protein [Streptomyces ipomoeae]MDX2932405.1 DUF397 domain-containing protein [Streptomyces ipomoeae]